MQREVKSRYILILVGSGVGECGKTAVHIPLYDFNDEILGDRYVYS